ncbi:hypothetical protein BD311DRAFT_764717 [Dichomitus squalens]|uniref:Uncharacterized protein n=1 Tax=Dichomitus squalens TaxID=114155 RepID=A0A4Q9MFS3_9APHY|nr:hypothetical protein BD311DRAFT_764717 [Dichomitus squalens]
MNEFAKYHYTDSTMGHVVVYFNAPVVVASLLELSAPTSSLAASSFTGSYSRYLEYLADV